MANMKLGSLRCLLPSVFLLIAVTACDSKDEGSASSIAGYNYTIEGIQEFYINGQWGSNLGIGDGGGSYVCCVMLPKKWTLGLSATVTWERTDCRGDKVSRYPERKEDLDKWPMFHLTEVVPIEPYDRPYTTYVVFLPNDEVKIYVTPFGPDHPDHPSKLGRARPLNHPEWEPKS